MALDEAVQQSIASGDWPGAADQASYHFPFLGNARSSLTAWQQGDRSEAAFYAALFGLETLGPKGAWRRPAGARVVEGPGGVVGHGLTEAVERGSKLLKQAMPNPDAFTKSAEAVWKQGAQATLSNAGRALQKHAGRVGTAFSDIKFSGKTANQDAMKIIKGIMESKDRVIKVNPNGTTTIFDSVSKRGFNISREGLFNGFRNID